VQPSATGKFLKGDERAGDVIPGCYFSAPPECGKGGKCYKKEHLEFLSFLQAKK
jgi:hypothetical protein